MAEKDEEISPDQEIDFCTLAMFIIGKKKFIIPSISIILIIIFL